jgi:hypothetical protein
MTRAARGAFLGKSKAFITNRVVYIGGISISKLAEMNGISAGAGTGAEEGKWMLLLLKKKSA